MAAPPRAQESLDLLRESVAVLRASPARLELALSLPDLGAALRRKGERVAAREPLREAVEVAAECGATALAARAHDESSPPGRAHGARAAATSRRARSAWPRWRPRG